MSVQTSTTLKTYFQTGDFPTQAQFVDLIDSTVNAEVEVTPGGTSDDTTVLTTAIAAAQGKYLRVTGTLLLPTTASIDLTGILGIIGEGTLDFSNSTATNAMIANGSKTAIASGISIAAGAKTATVTAGLSLKVGDPILITSAVASPNPSRASYMQGQRVYVSSYSGTSLTFEPASEFAYTTSAYVWQPTENKLTIGPDITIQGPTGSNRTGFRLTLCDFAFHGTMRQFRATNILGYASRLRITGKILDTGYVGTPGSYGVMAADLSDMDVVGATIIGAWHAVAAGGEGFWNQDESGGSTAAASYPSSYRVTGGLYVSSPGVISVSAYAIDAHGITLHQQITGALIYGGVNIAAKYASVDNCQIFHDDSDGISFGSDYSVSTGWGYVSISNTSIVSERATGTDRAAIVGGGTFTELRLNNVMMRHTFTAAGGTYAKPIYLTGNIDRVYIDGLTSIVNNTGLSYEVANQIKPLTYLSLTNSYFKNNRFGILWGAAGAVIELRDSTSSDNEQGIGFRATADTAIGDAALLLADGLTAERNGTTGLVLQFADVIKIRGCTLRNNGQLGGTSSTNAAITIQGAPRLEIDGCDLRDTQVSATQYRGLFVTNDTTTLYWSNNDFTGNVAAGTGYSITSVTVARQRGITGAVTVVPDKSLGPDGTLTTTISITTGAKLGSTGAGWTIDDATDRGGLAKLAAGSSAETIVVPITGLPVGWTITGYTVRGQIESAGNTATLDAALRSLTVAAADLTDAAVTSGAIAQVSVTADTAVAAAVTGLTSVLTAGKSYYLLITGTTAASTDIDLASVDITIQP